MPNKLWTNLENFVAVLYRSKKLWEPKVWKVVKFSEPTCPIFAGPVTYWVWIENHIWIIMNYQSLCATLWCLFHSQIFSKIIFIVVSTFFSFILHVWINPTPRQILLQLLIKTNIIISLKMFSISTIIIEFNSSIKAQ